MDIEQFIKAEQHSPMSLTDQQKQLSCFMHFYPLDSSLNDQEQLFSSNKTIQQMSTEDVIAMIEEKLEEKQLDFRTAHMSDILRFAETNFNSQISDWNSLKKGITKRKRNLKRAYAKERSFQPKVKKQLVIPVEVEGNEQSSEINQKEIKKKRNRMSAQISRDRKKEKMKELEESLRLVKEEADRVKLENQKLKKELSKVQQIPSFPYKNKFISFLVMMGIIFLFSTLKDLFKAGQSQINFPSFESSKESFMSPIEQQQLIGKGKQFLEQMENEEGGILEEAKIKKIVIERLDKLQSESSENVLIPKKLLKKVRVFSPDFNEN